MLEEGFTRVDVRAEGRSRVLEIPSDFNILEDTVNLVSRSHIQHRFQTYVPSRTRGIRSRCV